MPAQPKKKRPSRERGSWPITLGQLLAGIGTFLVPLVTIAIFLAQRDGDDPLPLPTTQTTVASATTTPVACRQLPQRPEVVELPDANRMGLSFPTASYRVTVSRGSPPWLEQAGSVVGQIPDGMGLHSLGWADPSSIDSLGNHGDEKYRLAQDELTLNSQGCWAIDNRRIAYEGAQGLVFRAYFVLIADSILPRVKQYLATHGGAMTGKEVRDFGLVKLAYFEVKV